MTKGGRDGDGRDDKRGCRAAGGEEPTNERGWVGSESCERENILFLFFGFFFVFRGLLLILRRNLINLLIGR